MQSNMHQLSSVIGCDVKAAVSDTVSEGRPLLATL